MISVHLPCFPFFRTTWSSQKACKHWPDVIYASRIACGLNGLGLFVVVVHADLHLFFSLRVWLYILSYMAIICKYVQIPIFLFLGKQIWTWRLKFCAFESAYATRMPSRLPLPFVSSSEICLRRVIYLFIHSTASGCSVLALCAPRRSSGASWMYSIIAS